MSSQQEYTAFKMEQARADMNYWKKGRSIDEVFAFELSLNLICDNIRSEYQSQALATMGLTRLPDVLLLVQVDDYMNKCSEMTAPREFLVKAIVWECLREQIRISDYDGFVANLLGLDILICFLCLPKQKNGKLGKQSLYEFSNHLCQVVKQKTGTSVTLCISDFCHQLSDFPKAYTRSREALLSSFYLGKNAAVVSSYNIQDWKQAASQSQFIDVYPAICVTISNGDQERFVHILREQCKCIVNNRLPPGQVKTSFAGLIHTMEVYAQNCGCKKTDLSSVEAKYVDLVLRSSYLEDALQYLMDYHSLLSQELEKIVNRDVAQAFREPIQEYVRNHYRENISLQDLARITGYSTYYFTRLFKKYFGCTMTEYMVQFRIEQSKRLLSTKNAKNISLGEIAERCGFDTANDFSRCFHRRVGMTPSEYRNCNIKQG